MGAMFQEKLDIYGGGMFRYIPKLLPFNCPDGKFDFREIFPQILRQAEILGRLFVFLQSATL